MSYTITSFSTETKGALIKFKRIWRQNKINFIENGLDINDLRIKRSQINTYSDPELYCILQEVANSIHSLVHNPETKLYAHKGLTLFLETLQSLLTNYHLTENKQDVVHKGKYASELLLSILQELPKEPSQEQPSTSVIQKLNIMKQISHTNSHDILKDSLQKLVNQHKPLQSVLKVYL